jgi:hypothetical protein
MNDWLKLFSARGWASLATLLCLEKNVAGGNAYAPETLAYHLSTNAVARAQLPPDLQPFTANNSLELDRLTSARWSPTCWLHGVAGLSATPIGFTNLAGGQGLPTLVSPRHYLCATHMHPESYRMAFLGTNNELFYRRSLQRVNLGNDISVGILDRDLPPAVEFLPVLPANYTNYLPTTATNFIQGIGMNQDFAYFGEPMLLGNPAFVTWNCTQTAPGGLGTNWNVRIRGGDSSNPALLLIGNQLVLVSHNYTVGSGPNYALQIPAINEQMHFLSINNAVGSDYQLTEFCLTNWPAIR